MARICFLRIGATPLFLAQGEGEFGGAEVRALTFARALAGRGHDVDFAVAPHSDLVEKTSEGIRVVPLPHRVRGVQKLVKSLRGRWNSIPQSFSGHRSNSGTHHCLFRSSSSHTGSNRSRSSHRQEDDPISNLQ